MKPSSSAARPAGRPVTTATAPMEAANARNAAGACGCGFAAPGLVTIGASVPSKSTATSAVLGSPISARKPSMPAVVRGTGSRGTGKGTAATLLAARGPILAEHEGEVCGRDAGRGGRQLADGGELRS